MPESKPPVVIRVVNMDMRSPGRRWGPVEFHIDLIGYRDETPSPHSNSPDPDMLVPAEVKAALLEWLQS